MVNGDKVNPPADAAPQPHRRWARRLALGTLVVTGMVCITLWVVTRPWFLIRQSAGALQDAMGGEVTIGDAAYAGGGVIVLHDVVVRAPTLAGEAGEIFRVDRGEVKLRLSDLLRGRVHVREITLDQVRLRISEARDQPGRFNFMALEHEWSGDESASELPSLVRVNELEIQMGVHHGEEYEVVGSRRLSGEMSDIPGRPGWFDVKLLEDGSPGEGVETVVATIRGQWNVETFEHRVAIEGVALDERAFEMCPESVRRWCREMDLRGQVPGATIHWSPEAPLSAELQMQDVELTLPIEAERIWAKYQNGRVEPSTGLPRMRVRQGSIRVEGEALILEIADGVLTSSATSEELTPVPYRVHMHIPSLRSLNREASQSWIEQMVKAGAFDLTLHMDEFTLARREDGSLGAVELPWHVARVLQKFQMTGWSLSTEVHVKREFAVADDEGVLTPQPIQASGKATIRDAAGSYFKFPFPLENVSAELEFDDDAVYVRDFRSSGPGGEQVRITGRVAPPREHAAVQLHIEATNLPLDRRLRDALPEDSRRAYDSLFDRDRFEQLHAAGLIPGEEALTAAAERHRTLSAEMALRRALNGAESNPGSASLEELETELARLDRIIDAGPFELGGVVNLDLQLDRPEGPKQRTVMTGTVTVLRAGVIHDRFGYPFHILGGKLDWRSDEIVIVPDEHSDGLRVATLPGGVGTVTGGIRTPLVAGRKRVQPTLAFDVREDKISELLFAAIPGEAADSVEPSPESATPPLPLSPGGAFLRSLGLDASVDWAGTISTADDHRTNYDFLVQLSHARMQPLDSLSEAVGAARLIWPAGFTLMDGVGKVRVTPESVEVIEFAARREESEVHAAAFLDLNSEPKHASLQMNFTNLACDDYLLSLVPSRSFERAANLWSRYQPRGFFDAELSYAGELGGTHEIRVAVEPREMTLFFDAQPVTIRRTAGHLTLGREQLILEELRLDLFTADRADGSIELSGSYAMGDAGDELFLDGTWSSGRFETSLITEIMKLAGAENLVPRYLDFGPVGEFDAAFRHTSARDGQPRSYEITVRPRTAALTVAGQRIEARFDDAAEVKLTPGLVTLSQLRCVHPGGELGLDGTVRTTEDVEADLSLTYRAPSISPQLLACLPGQVRDALQAIHFDATGALVLEPSKLHVTRSSPAGAAPRWSTDFDGVIRTEDASFSSALSFDHIDGTFAIRARQHEDGHELDIQAQADRVRIAGRDMTAASASIHLDDDQSVLHMPDFRADCYGGAVAAEAKIGLNDNLDYVTAIEFVGVRLEPFSRTSLINESTEAAAITKGAEHLSGELFATFNLAGRRGESASRSGRGMVRVINARMADMPLTLGVLQLLELMPPLAGSFDFADVPFFIEGDRVVFERLFLESPTLELVGTGEMNFDSLDLNMTFRSRGTMVVWSDLVTLFSDQLFLIEVTGTLGEPKARLVALPGMRKSQDARTTSDGPRIAGHPE